MYSSLENKNRVQEKKLREALRFTIDQLIIKIIIILKRTYFMFGV